MIRETSEEKFLKILRDGEPFALDDQNHIADFNLSTKEITTILEKICKKSSLLAEDVSDLWNPKSYYQFEDLYFCLSGGGMSAEVIEVVPTSLIEDNVSCYVDT